MKNSKLMISVALVLGVSLFSVGCNKSETLNNQSDKALKSLQTTFKAFPDKIGFHKVLKHWNFTLPSKELFEWTKDVGENKADYAMVLMAQPFIKAGLNTSNLKDDNWLFKPAEVEDGKQLPDRLIHPYNISDNVENSNGWEDALRRVFNKQSSIIQYDEQKKMSAIKLGEGFEVQLIENVNPKDSQFVFKINSKALVAAGLNVEKIKEAGWNLEGNEQLTRSYKLEYK